MELDQENGNNSWKKVIRLEIQQLLDYNTFHAKGLTRQMASDYTKIRCHMIFTVKHDCQHKARFVTGGHLTQLAIESVYSGVVSIHSIHLILLITELNDLEIYQANVGNAHTWNPIQRKDVLHHWERICRFQYGRPHTHYI